jgi:hypothetical protein
VLVRVAVVLVLVLVLQRAQLWLGKGAACCLCALALARTWLAATLLLAVDQVFLKPAEMSASRVGLARVCRAVISVSAVQIVRPVARWR